MIQKELNDVVSALGVVEEDKERPVNEPCPLLERLERGGDRLNRTKIEIQVGGKNGKKHRGDRQRRSKF